jgi:ferric-dicitrate binding protein FerR (iron transport regulator)
MSTGPDRSIETLIRLAGEREMPSGEATARARDAAEASWRRMLASRPPRARARIPLALAATLALGVLGWYAWTQRQAAAPPVIAARIVAVDGNARIRHGRALQIAKLDGDVTSGATLLTTDGRAAATIANALSLRLDHDTRLRFDAPGHVTLLQGGLYVDSGGLGLGPPLTIATPAGELRHIGTQCLVRVSGEATSIRVREGRVALRRGDSVAHTVAAGDALEIRGQEERWQHGLASFGPDWEWSATLAQTLAIEDRPLSEFLAWMAREHGWQLHFSDEQRQRQAQEIHLHGSLQGLDARAMLERVALVTGVSLVLDDGVLWVGSSR